MKTVYRIERNSENGFHRCNADVETKLYAEQLVKGMLKDNPNQQLRIVEISERVILLSEAVKK